MLAAPRQLLPALLYFLSPFRHASRDISPSLHVTLAMRGDLSCAALLTGDTPLRSVSTSFSNFNLKQIIIYVYHKIIVDKHKFLY
jgi:hypothetical protein